MVLILLVLPLYVVSLLPTSIYQVISWYVASFLLHHIPIATHHLYSHNNRHIHTDYILSTLLSSTFFMNIHEYIITMIQIHQPLLTLHYRDLTVMDDYSVVSTGLAPYCNYSLRVRVKDNVHPHSSSPHHILLYP